MDFMPPFKERFAVFLDDAERPDEVAPAHAAIGNCRDFNNVDPRFPVAIDIEMRRFMVVGVDDKPEASDAEHRDHR
jgi:hypothetical protein